jgi:hypothetical protein
MTRPHADEATQTSAASRVRPRVLRTSFTGTRWGLRLGSLFVAVGAVLLITLTDTGGAATQVPSAIQIGRQAPNVTSSVPTSIARPSTSTSVPPTVSVTHRTTVIKPLSTVTDREDGRTDDTSNGTTTGARAGTTTTTPWSSADN